MLLANRQWALKPQDVVVLTKIGVNADAAFTFLRLASEIDLAPSAVHGSVSRLIAARLLTQSEGFPTLVRQAALEFLLYGVRYCFPPVTGSATRGIATAYAAPPLRDLISQAESTPPVWPSPSGDVRGFALYPLYSNVPSAAQRDIRLYECLALIDSLRLGAARERDLAVRLLGERL